MTKKATTDVRKQGLKGKRIVVVGMAKTGVAAAEFLVQQGAAVTVSEIKTEDALGDSPQQLRSLGAEVEVGVHAPETFLSADVIVLSPGVDPATPPLEQARAKGIPFVSEVELASWFLKPRLIAVTGTNGKSTTTALIGHILSGWGKRVFVGGNIGTPLTEYLLHEEEADYIVAEISSFQLEAISSFKPWIALLLNLGEDHLDRHPTLSSYAAIKARIFLNQGAEDWAVVNNDDAIVRSLTPQIKARILPFGRKGNGETGVWLEDARTVLCRGVGKEERFSLERVKIRGMHNRENIMAAIGAATICGMPPTEIQQSLDSFEGLEHRLEWVGRWNGVNVYNDSKATNVASTLTALMSLDEPIILLAGGRDKGGDYSLLREPLKERVKALILMGEAREKMQGAFQDLLPCHLVGGMEEGIRVARSLARAGDAILLSPACSSFDMFTDYEDRGRTFKKIVLKLAEEEA
jgi:UDP-N-acetylmuramoylalanine--D-glutamate ligase